MRLKDIPDLPFLLSLLRAQGAIAQPDAEFVFDQCIETGLARFCDAVNRDPATGFLYLGDGYVDVRNTNIGAIRTRGVDVTADDNRPFYPWGFNYDHDEQGSLAPQFCRRIAS